MKKLLLIDGSSLLHRAFYALPLLHNALGEYTNGVYGFMTMLNRMLTEQQPDYVIICFDEGRITFRNEIFADYKGTRQETPRELRNQFEILKEVLDAGGIFHIEKAGYEADDLIGTFSRQAEEDGCKTLLFSGDKDVFQLIDDYTDVFMTRRGITNIDVWNVKTVQDVYGLTPAQLIDFKALMGDSSDNIPGVPGVGEKTALKLMQQFGSVANLYQNLDQVKGEKLRQKLADNQELVTICQKLAKIDRRVPVEIEWDKYRFSGLNGEALRPVYQRLEFNRLLKDLKDTAKPVNDSADKAPQFISEMLENTEDLNKLVVDAQNAGQCACYFTWKGQAIKGEITDFGLAIDGKSYAIDFLWQREAKLASLAPIFSDSAIDKVVANSKELSEILAAYNYDLSENTQDVILAAYVLDPSVSEYKVRDLAAENNLFLAPCDDPVMETACMASVLESLHDLQEEQLREKKMWELYEKIELPTARVLAQMERAGITVEGEQLRLMSDVLAKKSGSDRKGDLSVGGRKF
jgi:DNA polymerase-1